MGCWNKTCGLSNLHIRAGDPVYVFVLENLDTKERDNFCYSTAFYRPLLLPFESVYNDYGGGERSSGAAFDLIMNEIKESLVEMPLGENQYHDIAVTKDKFGEELFFDAVHEDRLKIKYGRFGGETKLQFVMFRKDVVDDILKNYKRWEYVGDGNGDRGYDNSYKEVGFDTMLNDLPEFINEFDSKMKALGDDEMKYWRLSTGFDMFFPWDHPNMVAKYLRGDTHRYSRLVPIMTVIIEYLKEGRREELGSILKEYLKGAYIDVFMHMTRKSWMPGAHEGSQSQEHHGYRVLISAMEKALDAEKKEYEEDNGEEFCEF